MLSAFRYRIEKLSELVDTPDNKKNDINFDKRKPIEAELTKARKQKNKLYDLLEQGVYDTDTFLERSKIVSEKIKALETAITEIDNLTKSEKLSPKELTIRLQYVIDRFESATPEEKNDMLKSVVKKIYYTKTQKMCYRKTISDLTLEVDFL